MLSRASKYLIPMGVGVGVGASMACFPTTVFAESYRSNPSRVYAEPQKESTSPPADAEECKDTELERLVMMCRQELERLDPLRENMSKYSDNMGSALLSAYGSMKDNICYLRTRAPEEVRIGTIVAGGLFGMMLGFRRRLARKLLFGSLGAGGAAYLVYPEKTVYVVKNGVPVIRHYLSIAFNFVVGDFRCECASSCEEATPPETCSDEQEGPCKCDACCSEEREASFELEPDCKDEQIPEPEIPCCPSPETNQGDNENCETSDCGGGCTSNEDSPEEPTPPYTYTPEPDEGPCQCDLCEERREKEDCKLEKLSASEMCRMQLKDLFCDCPKCVNIRGPIEEPSVWTPAPPPPCPYCGAEIRGDNENCALCSFTRRARDPLRYDYTRPNGSFNFCKPTPPTCLVKIDEDRCDSDEFDMTPQGTPIFEGGMYTTDCPPKDKKESLTASTDSMGKAEMKVR